MVSNHAEQVICLNRTVRCSGGLSVLSEENLLKTYGLHIQIYPHTHGPHCRLDGQTDLPEVRKDSLGEETINNQ